MKRFLGKGLAPRSREDVEREAAAELAAATSLGRVESPVSPGGTEEAERASQ
jgi:hypothetical protein